MTGSQNLVLILYWISSYHYTRETYFFNIVWNAICFASMCLDVTHISDKEKLQFVSWHISHDAIVDWNFHTTDNIKCLFLEMVTMNNLFLWRLTQILVPCSSLLFFLISSHSIQIFHQSDFCNPLHKSEQRTSISECLKIWSRPYHIPYVIN
jgi:hypothetical protein